MEVLSIVIICLVIGVVVGGILARVFSPKVALYGALLVIGAAAVLLAMGAQRQGWEGLGFVITALVFCAPLAVGMGLVGLLALYGMRRRR